MLLHRDWDGTYRTTREWWTEWFVVLIRRDFWGCPGFLKPYGFFLLRKLYDRNVDVLVAWYWFPFAWVGIWVKELWYRLARFFWKHGHLWVMEGKRAPAFWIGRLSWRQIPREDLMEDL